jgi:hypothetical protein
MNHNSVLTHSFGNSIIQQRESDGYINATAMCRATRKEWAQYSRLPSTQELLTALETKLETNNSNCVKITQLELVQSETGRYGGTWIHPYLAIPLAQWCSPAFAIQVSEWVINWFKGAQNPIAQPLHQQNAHIQDLQLKLQILQTQLEIANKHGTTALELTLIPLGGQLPAQSSLNANSGISPELADTPTAQSTPSTPKKETKVADQREKRRIYAKAWLKILKVRAKWGTQNRQYPIFEGDVAFCAAYNERRIGIDSWVYEAIKHTSRSTLARKRGVLSKKSARGLIPQTHSGRKLLIDSEYPEIRQFMDNCMNSSPYMCCGRLITLVQQEFSGSKMPSAATIRRYFDRAYLVK